jgi:hypothetical protein
MREPSFNETLQIGIVVNDLETAMRRYVDDYGIGPWDIHEFNAGNAEDLHEHGRPVERSWRLATTMVGRVQWELNRAARRRERLRTLPCREGRGCPPHRGCSNELRPGVGGPGEERA